VTQHRSSTVTVLGAAVGLAALAAMPSSANACSANPYLGSICMMAGTYCPRGFEKTEGQLLPIRQYQSLYAIIRTTYGGDGTTTFALPDLRGRSPVGVGTGLGLSEVVQAGQRRGVETVTQTLDTLAPHTHVITSGTATSLTGTIDVVPGAADGTTDPTPGTTYHLGAVGGKAASGPYTTTAPTGVTPAKVGGVSVTLGAVQAQPTGRGMPETNLPPQMGIVFCIATDGVFPPRN